MWVCECRYRLHFSGDKPCGLLAQVPPIHSQCVGERRQCPDPYTQITLHRKAVRPRHKGKTVWQRERESEKVCARMPTKTKICGVSKISLTFLLILLIICFTCIHFKINNVYTFTFSHVSQLPVKSNQSLNDNWTNGVTLLL